MLSRIELKVVVVESLVLKQAAPTIYINTGMCVL